MSHLNVGFVGGGAPARVGGSGTNATKKSRRCERRLRFGAFFRKDNDESTRAADYLTVWLGTHSKAFGHDFNPHWHGRMLERVRAQNATAVYYAYVIAMLARHTRGIQDCDVGSPNLCEHGAEFVRQHEALILDTYESYANRTAAWLGRATRIVWLMEPDYHQYTESRTQRGGGLAQGFMVRLFVQMVSRIKRHLPAALISLDASPWLRDVGAWMGPFLQHGSVDFVHTSGGRTTASSPRVRAHAEGNPLTWADLHRLSGRGIIADTGYGVGGRLAADVDGEWLDRRHLEARVADGVIAVTFANAGAGWSETVAALKTALPSTRRCFLPPGNVSLRSSGRRARLGERNATSEASVRASSKRTRPPLGLSRATHAQPRRTPPAPSWRR